MKVYVVVGRVDYEESGVLGVAASREGADAIIDERRNFEALPSQERERLTGAHGSMSGVYTWSYDDFDIEEFEVR